MAMPLVRPGLDRIAILVAAAVALALGAAPARGDDDEVPLAKVPAVVRKAADAAVAGAKWSAAYTDRDDSGVIYELDGTDAKGRDVIVEITAAGKVREIETEIPIRDVPAGVQKALKAKFPRFVATASYEVVREGKVAGFAFEGRRPRDKEDIDVFVSVDGKTVEIEE